MEFNFCQYLARALMDIGCYKFTSWLTAGEDGQRKKQPSLLIEQLIASDTNYCHETANSTCIYFSHKIVNIKVS
jgi:hypothetical protein